jgi:hypothetical protein
MYLTNIYIYMFKFLTLILLLCIILFFVFTQDLHAIYTTIDTYTHTIG